MKLFIKNILNTLSEFNHRVKAASESIFGCWLIKIKGGWVFLLDSQILADMN